MDFKMRQFKFIPVIAFMLIYFGNASAQISRNEMISYYKMTFLYRCTEPFEVEKVFRDEVCGLLPHGLDRKSYLEIDSMTTLIGDEIRSHVEIIEKDSIGDFYPTRECVLYYCLNQYDSKDMDKMAKGFARKMRKVKPMDYHKY